MKLIRKIKKHIFGSIPAEENTLEIKSTKTVSKTESLAYLVYKYRQQKGLINQDNDSVKLFFEDDWAF